MEKIFDIEILSGLENHDEIFEGYCDTDSAQFATKKTYVHDFSDEDEDEPRFDYKYVATADWTEDGILYALYLVPTGEWLCEKKRKSVADFVGRDENEIDVCDIQSYGLSILCGSELIKGLEEVDESVFDRIASVVDFYDRTLGYTLDKYVNRIGTTGWDILDDALNGVDFVKATLDRYKKED